ncbi:unnamed protein product [Arctogadus glacialis]
MTRDIPSTASTKTLHPGTNLCDWPDQAQHGRGNFLPTDQTQSSVVRPCEDWLGSEMVAAQCQRFEVRSADGGRVLFSADEQEISIGTEKLRVTDVVVDLGWPSPLPLLFPSCRQPSIFGQVLSGGTEQLLCRLVVRVAGLESAQRSCCLNKNGRVCPRDVQNVRLSRLKRSNGL